MKYFFPLVFCCLLLSGCHEDDLINTSPNLRLVLSQDTVLFDTILTSRSSITRRFRIKNPNREGVRINEISLAGGSSSPYRLTVNSFEGPSIQDLTIAANDSVLCLVEVTIDPKNESNPYLVKDSVIIRWNTNEADVKLVSYGQDANYINGGTICDQVWTSDRPYVITRDFLVDSLCELTIEKGVSIFMDNGVRFLVRGKLTVRGDTGQQVVFRNSRFDEDYQEAPGQWDGIYFLQGSAGNQFSHTIIENGRIGLRIGTPDNDTIPDVTLRQCIIRHMSEYCVQSFTSDFSASNSLFYNAGSQLLFGVAGGSYRLNHCSIISSPAFFVNKDPSVIFSDNITLANNEQLTAPLFLEIRNSIILGDADEELLISDAGFIQSLEISSNLIKSNLDIEANFTFSDPGFLQFKDAASFDFRPDSSSIAVDFIEFPTLEKDLSGNLRDSRPDAGAYEFQKTN